ncbi:MAG TPA: beta-glucosidase BglX [Bacteroidales bacterium]|nr:beta-glucosidase BglX [Bacteroidales bacterium]
MKKHALVLLMAALFCSAGAQDQKMKSFIDELMGKMSIDEKIGQLNLTTGGSFVTGSTVNEKVRENIKTGKIGAILNDFSLASLRTSQDIAVKESPNHIPILFGMDVIHGYKTIFPIPLAMSCTWDLQVIENYGRIAAREATANGISWAYSPMVDIARDPRWGRIAEGSGEDPYLGSQIAAAIVHGYQGDNLADPSTMMACVKHFALYGGAQAGRDYNTVDIGRVSMYNYYLPPYKAAVDAGAGSVMTSFNVVDDVPATGNHWLLTKLLRDEWGFRGFVVTDYTAINEMISHGMGDLQTVSALALKAGTDMDMVGQGFLTTLKKSLAEGLVTEADIDLACRRVLEAKFILGLFDDPYRYMNPDRSKSEVLTAENRKAAMETAQRSIVLLKNEGQLLPLKKTGTVALIGPLADNKADMLGTWSMGGNPNDVVTIAQAFKKIRGLNVLYSRGSEFTDNPLLLKAVNVLGAQSQEQKSAVSADQLIKEAVQNAQKADVVVAVLGEPSAWSGEAASMTNIGLQKVQQDLLKALLNTGKPVVLVLVNGRPMTLGWENENVKAIVETWALGIEAGNAIASVIFGDYNPSGKLTTTFPASVGQIPIYYNHLNTGRPADPKNKFTSKYLDSPNDPVYPFGYGLSYTTFSYGDIKLSGTQVTGENTLTASVELTNTGKYAGEEVVQLYIQDPAASISRPVKELKDFRKVLLQPGEKKNVEFQITTDDLKFYNSDLKYDWEPGEFVIYIGTNSRDVKSARVNWKK